MDFHRFMMDLGVLLAQIVESVWRLFRNLDHQIAVWIPELVFCDLGVDITPGFDARMC